MWIKICGIRDEAGRKAAIDAGADAIGLNFYRESRRFVEIDQAARIMETLPASVAGVGVFVNESPEDVVRICNEVGLTYAQLHGDETPEMLARIMKINGSPTLIRAFRVGDEGLGEVEDYLRDLHEFQVELHACLIDARAKNVYGGSGRRAPWKLIADGYKYDDWPPLILAGGLTPDNVHDAIEMVRPWGVDVAGGVESAPGVKDKNLVEKLVRNARTP